MLAKCSRLLLLLVFLLLEFNAKAQQVFHNLDSLLNFAARKSIALQSGEIRFTQAKKAKLAAILSIPDPNGNAALSYTNNTRLPVNLFPAEIFGGQPGTFKPIKTGVQYITNENLSVELKLFNLQAWEKLKLSKINVEVTSSDNKLNRKALYEDIASIYYNIIQLQAQLKTTQQNLTAADSLQRITARKHTAGLVKQQDVSEVQVNYFNTEESVNQIQYLIRQQHIALKLLCNIPEADSLYIDQDLNKPEFSPAPQLTVNQLNIDNNLLKEKMAWSSYRQQKLALLPTVGLFFSQTTQQFNTQAGLFANGVGWIPSSYVGVKINFQLPTANSVSQIYQAKYNYELAQKNTEQARINAGLTFQQLKTDYEKALSQLNSAKKIAALRADTYQKNLLNYTEGIIGLDQTLDSFNQLVGSNYNLIAAAINVQLAQSKIDINNKTN